MDPPRSISVCIPTFQGAEFLPRQLAALRAQSVDVPWDVHAIDSGSTDGTLGLLRGAALNFPVPFNVRTIHPQEFDHGDTRNSLAAESGGELLVFLTQDAIPVGAGWLAQLAANFADPQVGAAYCRNVPRPDASLLARLFSEQDPGYREGRRETRLPPPEEYARLDAHARRLLYDFNDVASAVRRELWERHPFPRTDFGEDLLMSRALLEAGWTVVYDDAALVEHSHDWSAVELRARARVDGRFNAEWLGRTCVASRKDAATLAGRQLERDREALEAAGKSGGELDAELRRAAELRGATFEGLWEGGRDAGAARPSTRVLERTDLHVLYVVHGFPPDTWAGTEVYTLGLAQEVRRLGHRCTVLTRAPAERSEEDGGLPEFHLEHSEFEGLPVWRMTHRIDHQSLRESYASPRAEQVFRDVLERERPDVVHFQHLLHFSAALPRIARERGIPSVVTCNDYWALCARVQLVRPDGERCARNQGLGCLVCLKNKDPRHVAAARDRAALLKPVAGLVRLGAAVPTMPSVKLERIVKKRRVKLRRWIDSWDDLVARQPFVESGYAATDLQIAPSRFLRDRHVETGSFDPHRFVYSDYGMRTDHVRDVRRRPDPEGRVRFGFVGSLVWYKGVDVLVSAMRRLAGLPAVLRIHGAFEPETDAYQAELAAAAGENVEFRGRFDNDRLADVYADLDVLVVPSVWFENSPITIHEAYVARTPIVTSNIGGMAELVPDGEWGLQFEAGDADDLAAKLRRFVDEPELATTLGAKCPPVKTLAENAREMQFRYRSLLTIVRDPG